MNCSSTINSATRRAAIRKALTTPCRLDLTPFLNAGKKFGISRPAWSRLQNLLAVLKTGENFNSSSLAKILKLNPKTIHRDIVFLRGQGLKINFDHLKNSFQLSGEIPASFTLTKENA
jgi:HTH domain